MADTPRTPKITRNRVLEELLATAAREPQDGKLGRIYPHAVTEDVGCYLQSLIVSESASRTLEVGMGHGLSTLYICDALRNVPGAQHTAIDPYQSIPSYWNAAGLRNIKKAGYEKLVRFVQEQSCIVLPRLLWAKEEFDFAFIDGNHRFEYVMTDAFLIDKILKRDGILVFDDINWPAIAKVCAFLERNLDYQRLGEVGGRCRAYRKVGRDEALRENEFIDF